MSKTKKKAGIRCNHCGDELYSYHRHDFVVCDCKRCYIDGGDDYTRVGGTPVEDYTFIEKEVEVE